MKGEITIQTPTQKCSLEIENPYSSLEAYDKMRQLKDMVRIFKDEPFVVFLSLPSRMNKDASTKDPY